MIKYVFPLMIIILLLSSSLVAVSNQQTNITNTLIKTDKTNIPNDSQQEHIWPMYKNNAQLTGLSKYNTSNNPGHEKWKYFAAAPLCGSVAIDKDGVIYVGDSSMGYHAVYPNGTMKWKIELDGREYQSSAISPDGSIIFGTTEYLYSIYPNGTIKWKFGIKSAYICEPVVDSNGTIYTATSNGIVYAIYSDGTLKWQYYAADYIWFIALDKNENVYFGGPYTNSVFCLYPNGTLKWRYEKYNNDMEGPPAIDDNGTIYATFWHWLVALNPDGTEKWIVDFLENDWFGYPSIAPDGTLILSGHSDYITALNPDDGSFIWQYFDDSISDSNPASISADGYIYFCYTGFDIDSDKGYLCCLYPNGTLKWQTRLSTDYHPYDTMNIFCSPAIGADGTVYVTSWFIRGGSNYTDIGYIHAFEFADVIAEANGPYYGFMGEPVNFEGTVYWGNPPYNFHWAFGDGNSSNEQNPKYSYSKVGNYTISFTVTDNKGNQSFDTSWAWIQDGNEPPDDPIIDGPTTGKPEELYLFIYTSNDPEGTDIWYRFKTNDDWPSKWYGPYRSGFNFTKERRWWDEGVYILYCQTKDVYNAMSNWSEHKITIPRTHNPLFYWFLERFPMLERLLYLLR